MGDTTLLPQDRHLFPKDLGKFESRTNAQLLQWLRTVQQARRAYHHAELQKAMEAQQLQNSMHAWLHQSNPGTTAVSSNARQLMEGLDLVANDEDSDDEDDESYDPDNDHDEQSCSTANSTDDDHSLTDLAEEARLLHEDLEEARGFQQGQAPTMDMKDHNSTISSVDPMEGSITSEEDMDGAYIYSSDDSA